MTDYRKYINALRKCAKEYEGNNISTDHHQDMTSSFIVSDLCHDVANLLELLLAQELCEDAISRDELLKAIDTWDKFGCDADTKLVPYQDHYIPYIHYDDVVKCIKGMPSVTPQPKTGHWQKISADKYSEHVAYYFRCSECGKDIIGEHNYCANCGCRMEGSE